MIIKGLPNLSKKKYSYKLNLTQREPRKIHKKKAAIYIANTVRIKKN